jgi:hypothetical protein
VTLWPGDLGNAGRGACLLYFGRIYIHVLRVLCIYPGQGCHVGRILSWLIGGELAVNDSLRGLGDEELGGRVVGHLVISDAEF